jgi:predicted transcriptional regulator
MDTPHSVHPPEPETAAERRAREAKSIAEARASAAAGHVVSFEDVEAWVNSWDTGHELPKPRTRANSSPLVV